MVVGPRLDPRPSGTDQVRTDRVDAQHPGRAVRRERRSDPLALHDAALGHRRGVGVCGVYTYEVAETKVTQVIDFARQHQHPLQCTMEKE